MNTLRFQGIALILSAICGLLSAFLPIPGADQIIALIGTVLFILGIPSIQLLQPEGVIGWIGIALLEIAALISLVFQLGLVGSSVLAFTSALVGMLGRLVIGALTTRGSRFPAWAGWAFLLSGILNLVTGAIFLDSIASVIIIIAILLEAAALFAFGFRLLARRRVVPSESAI